jgi:hypothetical protein
MSEGVIQTIHYALSVLAFVGSMFMLVMRTQFISRKEFEHHIEQINDRFTAGSEKMAGFTSVIGRVEQALGNLPTKDDMHELALALRELGGDLKAIRAETKAQGEGIEQLRATLTRHEDIIAQGGRM